MVVCHALSLPFFFFFNDTATTEIYTLSLHDALPISVQVRGVGARAVRGVGQDVGSRVGAAGGARGRERGRAARRAAALCGADAALDPAVHRRAAGGRAAARNAQRRDLLPRPWALTRART